MAVIEHGSVEWFAALAERATERALDDMRSDVDASAPMSLAWAAWNVVMDAATDDERAELASDYILTDDDGYEVDMGGCICPPELLARDGFRGGCPVHA